MEIAQKGGSAELDVLKQLLVVMKWRSKHDFDLAALYKAKDGREGLAYFQEKGDLNAFPYMKLSGDAGVGDKVDAGGNEEQMKITKLDDMKAVHLIVWDYGAVQRGSKARFAESNVSVEVKDDKGNSNSVRLDSGEMGNVIVLAKIEVTELGAKLVNESNVGTLKGLSNTKQLWDIVGAQ